MKKATKCLFLSIFLQSCIGDVDSKTSVPISQHDAELDSSFYDLGHKIDIGLEENDSSCDKIVNLFTNRPPDGAPNHLCSFDLNDTKSSNGLSEYTDGVNLNRIESYSEYYRIFIDLNNDFLSKYSACELEDVSEDDFVDHIILVSHIGLNAGMGGTLITNFVENGSVDYTLAESCDINSDSSSKPANIVFIPHNFSNFEISLQKRDSFCDSDHPCLDDLFESLGVER